MRNRKYYVYIATNKRNTVFYTGITNDVSRRISEHRNKAIDKCFTKRYNVEKLIYCEEFDSPEMAIVPEKKTKGWTRDKKISLVKGKNPELKDFAGTIGGILHMQFVFSGNNGILRFAQDDTNFKASMLNKS